jgi:hypothetical protein
LIFAENCDIIINIDLVQLKMWKTKKGIFNINPGLLMEEETIYEKAQKNNYCF